METARYLLLPILLLFGAACPDAQDGYPEPAEFAVKVRQAMSRGYLGDGDVTYLERRQEIDISLLGKVTLGPVRTFEVYPSPDPGRTWKRLIAVDGQPLDDLELAKRDAEHARHVREAALRLRQETPLQRAARLQDEEQERLELEAMLDDAMAVFEPAFTGREVLGGRQVLVVELRPRQEAAVSTREGRWMQHFTGRAWIDEADHQVVRVDMRAASDITVGWGVVGRVDEGSRLLFSRHRFDDTWLPAELTYEASGRTLLVRPFRFAATTTYSDYRRTAGQLPGGGTLGGRP